MTGAAAPRRVPPAQPPRVPVAVGGLGGSGTRVVARALIDAGWYLGSDRNDADDTLWFTLLCKRPALVGFDAAERNRLLTLLGARLAGTLRLDGDGGDELRAELAALAEDGRPQHDRAWLARRVETFLDPGDDGAAGRPWGWKEPNTHLLAEDLLTAFPTAVYVHVTRDGLDMARSSNRNQASLWGEWLTGTPDDGSARYALRYWRVVTERADALAAAHPDRVLHLDFDALCADPVAGLAELFAVVGGAPDDEALARTAAAVQVPARSGAGRRAGTDDLDPDDVAAALARPHP